MELVTEILQETAESVILPRFRDLNPDEIIEKEVGNLATVVDRQAEQLIGRRLRGLLDAPIVGEEAVAEKPELIEAINAAPAVWLVDPLDGTGNFVAGRFDYAVMAALVKGGSTVAAWILRPVEGHIFTAEQGAGCWRDKQRIHISRHDDGEPVAGIRGSAPSDVVHSHTSEHFSAMTSVSIFPDTASAGTDYSRLLEGRQDFALFYRTHPWDHAPGALLVKEAGGTVCRLDGASYRPGDTKWGLLAATDDRCWASVSSATQRQVAPWRLTHSAEQAN